MTKFENRFFRLLQEQDVSPDRAAMEASLDKGTDPADFDASAGNIDADSAIQQANKALAQQGVKLQQDITAWRDKCADFANFLNDTTQGSMQYAITNADKETIMGSLQKHENDITRIAGDLRTLIEALNTAINKATTDANLKYV